MDKVVTPHPALPIADEYGNQHYLTDELASGGQGIVYRTRDPDLAIKQALDQSAAHLRARFQGIRLLPIPARIAVALPLAILRERPGYVMRLLNGMQAFGCFELHGGTRKALADQAAALPPWLTGMGNQQLALQLWHYASTGSTRRRLFALAVCAATLARLHSAGLVYGDISPNNVFAGDSPESGVWLIDADNMRFELASGGASVYTLGYGAPEVVRGEDCSRPRSDCWAFAVLAFKMLACSHPFIGKQVLEPDEDEGGWDAEPQESAQPADPDERAYAGFFPFVDDREDDANRSPAGLPRALVLSSGLRKLFDATFSAGRTQPHRRPAMAFWTLELMRAFDRSLACPGCGMSYLADEQAACPYCTVPRPPFIRMRSARWTMVVAAGASVLALPHRLFHPFSLEHFDATAYEAVADFADRRITPARGARVFPAGLAFEFVEGQQ